MKKIPTIFERDWHGDKSKVLDKINPECQWVFDGEGWPTRKLDGTCCLIKDGKLFKRREIKKDKIAPKDFILEYFDKKTNKRMGWIPVGDGPEDKYHIEAFNHKIKFSKNNILLEGTYELIGPKIQSNPENFNYRCLVRHTAPKLFINKLIDRTYNGIKEFLSTINIEGIVFHRDNGQMAKIKSRDFGILRK